MAEPDRRRTRVVGLVLAIAIVVAVVVDGEFDVPEWANVPGIDLPFFGDDPLRCDVLSNDASSVRVELSGAPDVVDDHVHLHVNGEPVDELRLVERRTVVPLPADGSDVYLSVATVAGADDRFWCGSANRADGVTEK